MDSNDSLVTIDDLPDEVLHYILSLLPPYQDLQVCMRVCRRWYSCADAVMKKTSNELWKAVSEFKIQWKNITPADLTQTISKRFSHSACIYENSMYIFGGCTTNATAFNDMWRFDLSTRQWVRLLATGSYPVPKAYASMTVYRDNLVLYGGWTYPSNSQYYQWTMFNEIHFYNITLNRWQHLTQKNCLSPVAGHSATMIGDIMVVFGGLVRSPDFQSEVQCSNDVWLLNMRNMEWFKKNTTTPKPSPRYAHSMIKLRDDLLMILGGVQAPVNKFVYNDCWLLKITGAEPWEWMEVELLNREWAARNIWCNPACRVGDKVVSLSTVENGTKPFVTSSLRLSSRNNVPSVAMQVIEGARRPVDRDQNVNGMRGVLPQRNLNFIFHKSGPSNYDFNRLREEFISRRRNPNLAPNRKIICREIDPMHFKMAAFVCGPAQYVPPPNNYPNQRDFEPRIENPPPEPPVNKVKRSKLSMHVLDISKILAGTKASATWLKPLPREVNGAPDEMVMYSLVKGKGELIMFGGMSNDIDNYQYSNSLHFITPPSDII